MTDKVLQWHPGFCAALQIELQEESGNLEFYPEYELSKKPMRKRDAKNLKEGAEDCRKKSRERNLLAGK